MRAVVPAGATGTPCGGLGRPGERECDSKKEKGEKKIKEEKGAYEEEKEMKDKKKRMMMMITVTAMTTMMLNITSKRSVYIYSIRIDSSYS